MTDSHPVDDLGCLFRIQIHKSHIFNVEFRSHSIPCVVQVQAFKITDAYEGFNSYWKSEYEVLSFFIFLVNNDTLVVFELDLNGLTIGDF